MTSDKHNFEELMAPAATAKELHISVATLRKYSLIVERVTNKSDYYARSKQKARLYSKQDIQDLKDFHRLAQSNGLTLQDAAQQVFAVSEQKEDTLADNEEKQEMMSTPQMMKLFNGLQQTIGQQNAALESLQEQLNRIEEQNETLLAKQAQSEGTVGKEEDFAALPDISGIVTDEDDTNGGIQDEHAPGADRPVTTAEKRAQVLHDEQKSSAQLHEEILAKAKENAQKQAAAGAHRTLEDMQVEPEKKHWWQRFINM